MSVVDIQANSPHLVVPDIYNNQHVIPRSFLDDVSSGLASIKDLEDYELIMPTIIKEWLDCK